jgi:hypothetical protein
VYTVVLWESLLPGGLTTATGPEGIALLGVRKHKLVGSQLREGGTPKQDYSYITFLSMS